MEQIVHTKDFFDLKHGDRVHRFDGNRMQGLYFVGFMPKSPRYLIFCEGEYLTHLYLPLSGTFKYTWYKGEYDSKFVGELMLEAALKKVETIKRIYLKETT